MAGQMTGPDYPIEHFTSIRDLAVEFKVIDAQILRHEYFYQSFGSWWTTIDYKDAIFRLMFDGRDDIYSIEQAFERQEPYHWHAPIWQLPRTTHVLPIDAIISVFREAKLGSG